MTKRSYEGVFGPGSTVGGFVIEAVAGRGGMGVVYKAHQHEPERVVALKVIAPELAGDSSFEERFKSEGRIAAQLEHPNVIPVYAVGQDRAVLYIAMRFVVGTDLGSVITSEGRIDAGRAAVLIDQVAQALDVAHGHGLVHRDVKPANILLTAAGGREHVYLTDFGLSRHIAATQALTATGEFVGTVDYVAPEQVRGEPVDARTDVYALGCVLFHAVTGRVPYHEGSHIAKLYAHDSKPPPSIRECVSELPAELDAVVARAMAKAPDERYQSAGDLGAAAIAAAGGTPVRRPERSVAVGQAAPRRPSSRRMAPRRRWALLGAAALFVGGVVAALVAVGGGGAERKGQSRTTAKASGTPQQRLLALIPPFTRAKCMPAAHGVADASAIASVECGLAGLDVVYQLFPSKSVMDQWYAQVRETAGIAPSSGTCTAAAFRGEFRLVVGGSTRGRYLCVLDGRAPRLYETEDRAGVGTELDYYAGTGAPAIQSLLRQWRCCTQLRAA